MTRQKVAILGGGFGALTTAWNLTATPEQREKYEVEIWQMGWRLGGKCATSRDAQNRVLEHGLHFWFGCYDNAWSMLRDLYEEWEKPAGCPFQTGLDAFDAQDFTPLWTRQADGSWGFWNVTWPTNDEYRGNGQVELSVRGMLSQLASLLKLVLKKSDMEDHPAHATLDRLEDDLLAEGVAVAHHEDFRDVQQAFAPHHEKSLPMGDLFRDVLHIGAAFAAGIVWDVLVRRKSLDALNAVEFREWLKSHGGNAAIVDGSSVVRAIYDCCFWYQEGSHAKPSVGTGTAVRVILRIVTTYKGSVMYTLKAGMAEAVVAPMYDVLRARGVKVHFFHKTTGLHLDADGRGIERIALAKQAVTPNGYEATTVVDGVPTWPVEPYWDQLKNGAALKAAGVDFENHWSPAYPTEDVVLTRGTDFDHVVLGISMGGYKPLNDSEPSLAQELIDAGGPFARMVEGIGLVPTLAAQVWLPETTEQLGWDARPATVGGPEAYDIWADMSQLNGVEGGSGSVHYFCGAYATTAYREPASASGTQGAALADVTAQFGDWVAANGTVNWCGRTAGPVPPNESYIRANIDPAECCVGSGVGEVSLRLATDETGFDNLVLAGCYVRTGLNTTCVESAVMSGMQASRAISGFPETVLGEHYL